MAAAVMVVGGVSAGSLRPPAISRCGPLSPALAPGPTGAPTSNFLKLARALYAASASGFELLNWKLNLKASAQAASVSFKFNLKLARSREP